MFRSFQVHPLHGCMEQFIESDFRRKGILQNNLKWGDFREHFGEVSIGWEFSVLCCWCWVWLFIKKWGGPTRGFIENRTAFLVGWLGFHQLQKLPNTVSSESYDRKKKEQPRGRKHKNCNINIIKQQQKNISPTTTTQPELDITGPELTHKKLSLQLSRSLTCYPATRVPGKLAMKVVASFLLHGLVGVMSQA